ncbi:nuclear export factor GLE1 [Mycobacterium alsense]|uniref:Nuclear export factor GLE1 n=1 Tax=Mycobacterium alsense TaxID=324058 RepID=A0AA42BVS9_9MYCO|nr:YcnI family protein [Mycobacterium alsense]MCV7377126.1 YcnI family protein [Mycobacterium alsense]OQZ87898.1 nuclear export factor GLE1 [Mycobacterium alsense]
MSLHDRRVSRVLTPLTAAASLCFGSAVGIPSAWAHVHASSDNPVRGATAVVTFKVPNESNTGAATTGLTVALPNVGSASTEAMPGWSAKLDRDTASGTVRSVTWTAAPDGGIGPDQFALFRISVRLPDAETVTFPATQTYADGSVVRWDQPPLPGGGEPEHPAPALTLTGTAGAPHARHPSPAATGDHAATAAGPDNAARLLGGAALLVAALGVALALIRRRT